MSSLSNACLGMKGRFRRKRHRHRFVAHRKEWGQASQLRLEDLGKGLVCLNPFFTLALRMNEIKQISHGFLCRDTY